MNRAAGAVALALVAAVGAMLATPGAAAAAEPIPKVAVIVGPVGPDLTPVYIEIAEAAAERAATLGANVARAYSPDATPERVIEAVANANIVVYLGHGVGFPNPYSAVPDPNTVNGWGLQGPNARGDHSDSWRDGTLRYFGEAWLAEHARPAPGWVMIYSNACYAPGAGEGFEPPADASTAVQRVANYSRTPLTEMGAAAYFATDFFHGAAEIITTLLGPTPTTYAEVFAAEPRYQADAVTAYPHPSADGAEIRLQRSPYFEGRVDYWYAFAGDPAAVFVPGATRAAESPRAAMVITGTASHYPGYGAWQGQATVALPVEAGGRIPQGPPPMVRVCADRCVVLPVVDSCPCYVGTAMERVANLSHEAWALVTDQPLSTGLIEVSVELALRSTDGP